jgi:short subunit dehydrogenase-like uncharacterized protein
MKTKDQILVYGSYGYTGKLIVDELRALNLPVILSGRDEQKLKSQSISSGFPYKVCDLKNPGVLETILEDCKLIIHCAGPFHNTAEVVAQACLKTGTHYTDITGEFEVFEKLFTLDEIARQKNITIMPGVGFDVVPTDCLAAHLKNRLPDASHLELAFTNLRGAFSRGTARTGIDNLGKGSFVRENGRLKNIKAGSITKEINFGPVSMTTVCIPWGDIASAFHSTGIQNITVFMGAPEKTIRMLKRSNLISWLLKTSWVKNWMKKKLDARPEGPSAEKRKSGKSLLWGKVRNAQGAEAITLLETADGYSLTAFTAASIANKIFNDNFKPGYQTPSMAFGPDLILEAPASGRTDV